jgi:DNA-binding LacI/PurR family transcriptional regulator
VQTKAKATAANPPRVEYFDSLLGRIGEPRGRNRRVVVVDQDKASIREMTRDLIDAGHRALAVKHHPDKPTGSVERMTRLNRARDVLVQRILDW